MKTFTARDLGRKRGEIRQAIKNGGCIVQYKHSDRSLEMECVMVPMDDYKRMARSITLDHIIKFGLHGDAEPDRPSRFDTVDIGKVGREYLKE